MATDDMNLMVDAGMLDLFRMEADAHSATLEKGLMELEGEPRNAKTIEPLMRAAHSIKGAARIVGLDAAVELAHIMEDIFSGLQSGTVVMKPELIDGLLQGVDVFKRISTVPAESLGRWVQEHAEEMRNVGKALSSLISDQTPAGSGTLAPPMDTKPFKEAELASEPAAKAPVESPAPPGPQPPSAGDEPIQAAGDTAVLVTAQNINRLMGLAGECLVESRILGNQVQDLYQLKSLLAGLPGILEALGETLAVVNGNEKAEALLNDAHKRAARSREFLARQIESFEMYMLRWENLASDLYNETVATRMRPFKDGGHGFPRMVRDMGRKLGKKIRLKVSGELTPVDRDILARLEAPLTHILRNACDHGLETPEERMAAGKPEEGVIHLETAHRAGMLSVIVSDDGRGIDRGEIRRRVVENGVLSREVAENLSEHEVMDFLFLPGFSTARGVTETSGRGVGLDVVRNMVQEVRGTVSVTSKLGEGTVFHLQLPLTLSVLRTLLVEISREPYALPLVRVDRVVRVPHACIELIEDRQYFSFEGRNIGLFAASEAMELTYRDPEGDTVPVVVISDRLNQYGVVVDRLLGEHEFVVRPLDPRLGKVPNINAAAVREDGSPVLIVDVDDLVRSIDNRLRGGRIGKIGGTGPEGAVRTRKRVLVVDDSITVREVERRLLDNKGYEVEVAVDGMDGWNAVRSGTYDLIVSDIDMPRMNGLEMVRHIKGDPLLKHLPIVIVSYKDREEDRIAGMQAGASAYLTKSSFYDESFVKVVVDLIGEP